MIRVLGDRVLVALPPKAHAQEATTGYTYQAGSTTASGILLAKPADVYNVDLATRGIVVALGEKSATVDLDDVMALFAEDADVPDAEGFIWSSYTANRRVREILGTLLPAPFDVAIGDCVLFAPTAGDQIHADGVDYLILHESDIIAVVEPRETEAPCPTNS